jgi:hypothetical protein
MQWWQRGCLPLHLLVQVAAPAAQALQELLTAAGPPLTSSLPPVPPLQHEYPQSWPHFFQELIGMLSQGDGIVDMYCRILIAVDEDLVSLDIPRSQDESRLSMHVKDSMREHSINSIADAWYQLVDVYRVSGRAAGVCVKSNGHMCEVQQAFV